MNSCSSTDVGTWIGDDEIPLGENHHVQVLAGLTFLSNVVVATDEQRMALLRITQDGRQQQDICSYDG